MGQSISLRQSHGSHSPQELFSLCPIGLCPRGAIRTANMKASSLSTTAIHYNWWRVTCTTPIPLSTVPTLTRTLPLGDSLDMTPAITAGSTQYFWPTVCITGWYLSRYGRSISAILSEARTPKANTERRVCFVRCIPRQELKRREEIHSSTWAAVENWEAHVWVWSSWQALLDLRLWFSSFETESASPEAVSFVTTKAPRFSS